MSVHLDDRSAVTPWPYGGGPWEGARADLRAAINRGADTALPYPETRKEIA